MKVVKINKLKPEIVDLNYDILNEEKEFCEKKGKSEKVASYAKLLSNLEKDSSPDTIEEEVNKIIDSDKERIKELKKEIKSLEKEINLLANYSQKHVDAAVLASIILLD